MQDLRNFHAFLLDPSAVEDWPRLDTLLHHLNLCAAAATSTIEEGEPDIDAPPSRFTYTGLIKRFPELNQCYWAVWPLETPPDGSQGPPQMGGFMGCMDLLEIAEDIEHALEVARVLNDAAGLRDWAWSYRNHLLKCHYPNLTRLIAFL